VLVIKHSKVSIHCLQPINLKLTGWGVSLLGSKSGSSGGIKDLFIDKFQHYKRAS